MQQQKNVSKKKEKLFETLIVKYILTLFFFSTLKL